MKRWYLQTLGTPSLLLNEDSLKTIQNSEVRFRYRDTWLLLASLAHDPRTKRRAALVRRLAMDMDQADGKKLTGSRNLTFRLNDLGVTHFG